jgi:hypothetical protein
MFIVFPIRVYSLHYIVLGLLLNTYCLSINGDLCNIVIMNKTQYNAAHYSLPLFLFRSFSLSYISLIYFTWCQSYLTWYQSHCPVASNKRFWRFLVLPPATSIFFSRPHAAKRSTFKIAVSLFHAFIVATSGKPMPKSGLQGTYHMI